MKKIILIGIFLLATGTFSQAQVVPNDSISTLKKEQKDLEISKRLNANKIKLSTLQNTVQQKTDDISSTRKDAKNAAADNQKTAQKLSNDPEDKRLARRSRRDARHAQTAATAGRNATEDLKDLQNEITSIQKKIAADEAKLAVVALAVPQKIEQ